MSPERPVNDEMIHAYLDGELGVDERSRMIREMENDPGLSSRVERLRQDRELVQLAYADPPMPDAIHLPVKSGNFRWPLALAASLVLLLLGGMLGRGLHQAGSHQPAGQFVDAETLDVNQLSRQSVLVHIPVMDANKVDIALNRAEEILNRHPDTKHIEVEIVANASGLALLRDGSPYAARIRTISEKYNNVSFKACGIAMENARLKEGNEIKLLPEADKIPAALERILERVRQGWVYVKS